jgi:hypothetical protein
VVQTVTSSISFITGSTKFGALASNTHQFTGSMYITGGFYVSASAFQIISPSTTYGGAINLINTSNNKQWNITNVGSGTGNRNGNFEINNNSIDILAISQSGNIGIGTTSPAAKLTVVKSTRSSTLGASSVLQISDASAAGQAVGDRAEINFYTNSDSLPGNLQHATIGIIKTSTSGNETADLYFGTSTIGGSPVERMRITSDGLIRINGASGFGALDVGGQSSGAAQNIARFGNISGVNNGLLIQVNSSNNYIYNFGTLGTGTVSATSGVLSASSDKNLKNDDGGIENALSKVLQLNPRYFQWKEESSLPTDIRQLGFYAQDVNAALGEEVANTPKDENDKWGIYDRALIAMLTKAIQELKAENDTLKEILQRNNIQ